ncbi:MAG TPA: hypothetical protein VGD81_18580, partial [Opitutaceae bacterium]
AGEKALAGGERPGRPPRAEPAAAPLPGGEALLARIRPMMRRNRRGPGFSGSTGYLAKALKQSESELVAALGALGLQLPEKSGEKPAYTEIGGHVYWLNKDGRGGIWINGRERRERPESGEPKTAEGAEAKPETETAEPKPEAEAPAVAAAEVAPAPQAEPPVAEPAPATEPPQVVPEFLPLATAEPPAATAQPEPSAPSPQPAVPEPAAADAAPVVPPVPSRVEESTDNLPVQPELPTVQPTPESGDATLASLRLLLKPNRRGGGAAADLAGLAHAWGRSEEALRAALTAAGFALPADADAKPVLVEHGDEVMWVNFSAKDGSLWLNARAKTARKPGASRGRSRKKAPDAETMAEPAEAPDSPEAAEAADENVE